MKLFDSHCHLDDRSYDKDIDAVIKRANDAGVEKMMIVGINKKSSIKAVSLAESKSFLFASVGIHPHDSKQCDYKTLKFLRTLAGNPSVHAWGEIGLDFNRMYSPKIDQELCFIKQIEIADELNLPIIFHERDSNGRFLEILKRHSKKRKGVVHCFSGNKTELSAYLELGFYIGITGIITIKQRGANLRNMVSLIPREKILIETDAPYLTPAPIKNSIRRNEPAFVKSVLFKLAEAMGEDPVLLADQIWENSCRLFNIRKDH